MITSYHTPSYRTWYRRWRAWDISAWRRWNWGFGSLWRADKGWRVGRKSSSTTTSSTTPCCSERENQSKEMSWNLIINVNRIRNGVTPRGGHGNTQLRWCTKWFHFPHTFNLSFICSCSIMILVPNTHPLTPTDFLYALYFPAVAETSQRDKQAWKDPEIRCDILFLNSIRLWPTDRRTDPHSLLSRGENASKNGTNDDSTVSVLGEKVVAQSGNHLVQCWYRRNPLAHLIPLSTTTILPSHHPSRG